MSIKLKFDIEIVRQNTSIPHESTSRAAVHGSIFL